MSESLIFAKEDNNCLNLVTGNLFTSPNLKKIARKSSFLGKRAPSLLNFSVIWNEKVLRFDIQMTFSQL